MNKRAGAPGGAAHTATGALWAFAPIRGALPLDRVRCGAASWEWMAARAKQVVEVEGRQVTLSNLDKVMFPDTGFTKGQVIDYYIRVAPFLLPHLKKRPVTMKRYPDGSGGAHFYEKQAPRFTPDWVDRFAVPRRTGGPDIQYVLLNDLPSLAWSANTANLELHPFLCRVPDIQRPTALVFDLDPGEGTGLVECARVACLLRDVFATESLESVIKVSGSKGMQLYVPLNTAVSYEQTQPYAHGLAQRMEQEHPGLVVADMAKAKRTGKVLIDWSQNADFKTTVSVYSLRAKSGSPWCSMPVEWNEVVRAVKRHDTSHLRWDPDAALRRLDKLGDLFQPLLKLRQKLPRHRTAGIQR